MVRRLCASTAGLSLIVWGAGSVVGARQTPAPSAGRFVQFVFTSDAHYGITRGRFRGASDVDAHVVNAAMIAKINELPGARFPDDGGLRAGTLVGPLDFLAEGGDVANRSEVDKAHAIQSAAVSWSQFRADYLDGLTLTARDGARSPVYVVPGNHDVSNAIGFYAPMHPRIDNTAMVGIYNLMMAPAQRTTTTYEYATDRVLASRDVGGAHFVFLTVWPDSVGRAWLDRDLRGVPTTTPVMVVTHDQPDAQSKHFTNPNGAHDINAVDRFENLLADPLADGTTTGADDIAEQSAWETFLARHANVVAYFHGNSNWNEFYDWRGPHRAVALHTFRADSPMKGHVSEKDETKLSFQVVTIDAASRAMTVRECLWNADLSSPAAPLSWGASATVTLGSRR
ncbi:MAG: metallophosphoesterase [Acidobacteriia bacterium]|nr:metallophosphoesterase [Terriglobia bacterium]